MTSKLLERPHSISYLASVEFQSCSFSFLGFQSTSIKSCSLYVYIKRPRTKRLPISGRCPSRCLARSSDGVEPWRMLEGLFDSGVEIGECRIIAAVNGAAFA